jgi:hypothetical protein
VYRLGYGKSFVFKEASNNNIMVKYFIRGGC